MEYGVSEFTVNATPVGQPQAITMRDADQWNVMFGGGRESLAGVKVTHKSVMGCPAFWRGREPDCKRRLSAVGCVQKNRK
jgi:hypothetical protein